MNLRSMTDIEKCTAAKLFVEIWAGTGYQQNKSQKFWLSLLTDVMGVEHASEVIYRLVIQTRALWPVIQQSLSPMQHYTILEYADSTGHPRSPRSARTPLLPICTTN